MRIQGAGIIIIIMTKTAGIAYGRWPGPKYSTSPRNRGTVLLLDSFLLVIVTDLNILGVILVH